jgi:hydrogenase maturation protein HypF
VERTTDTPVRRRFTIAGVVQGVGFRPFVSRLASSLELGGYIVNAPEGVIIEIEGPAEDVAHFAERIGRDAPAIACLTAVHVEDLARCGETRFVIRPSREQPSAAMRAQIPPDLGICDRCREEIFDPENRRYGYAFTNCTLCGPRYTVIERLPYDRMRTSMAGFPLCEACAAEYADPKDRRFHAEPTACPGCGPRLWLTNAAGMTIAGDPIAAAAGALVAGRILALKGLGGFQLAADAANSAAIATLRARKLRPAKPLALMVRDLTAARQLAVIGSREAALLASAERPIVLFTATSRAKTLVSPEVAPGESRLGIFLPTTALHELLLARFAALSGRGALVMTSGNRLGEPIACSGDAARATIGAVADLFLDHNRPIVMSADDPVVRADRGLPFVIRRGRGQAPSPFSLGADAPPVLASGGDLKNALCVLRDANAFLGGHVADLESLAAEERWRETARGLLRLLGVKPAAVAVDLHPDARATRLGSELAAALGIPVIPVQHHHAHIASCLVENEEHEPVLGVALDGAGLGIDGAIWGGEILVADRATFRRVAHLSAVPLPGGDRAAREPWRMAVSHLEAAYGSGFRRLPLSFLTAVPAPRLTAIHHLVRAGEEVLTTSAGRLFDAVAAILGLCLENRHEGEAAMALEAAITGSGAEAAAETPSDSDERCAEFGLGSLDLPIVLPVAPLIRGAVDDAIHGRPIALASRRFHRGLASLLLAGCRALRRHTGLTTVALSGGVFQNAFLAGDLGARLERDGFRVLRHRRVPPGDGGIALGQAVVAAEALKRRDGRSPAEKPPDIEKG